MMKSHLAKLFNQFEEPYKENKVTNRQMLSHAESLSERKKLAINVQEILGIHLVPE